MVKTHTPLDGVVIDPRATYVVVVRDPLDMAVSLYHQGDNLDRERIAELTGRPASAPSPRPPLTEWLVRWTMRDVDPMEFMDSLAGVVHHAADAWARRDDEQVLVVRYEDLVTDLEGRMRWLSDRLDTAVDPRVWAVARCRSELREHASRSPREDAGPTRRAQGPGCFLPARDPRSRGRDRCREPLGTLAPARAADPLLTCSPVGDGTGARDAAGVASG